MKSLLILLTSAVAAFANLPEVDFVFYGKVVHLGGGEPYLVSQGELQWEIAGPTGSVFSKATSLSSMNGGAMSYQMRVPQHLVIAETLASVLPGVPLLNNLQAQPFESTNLTLNGQPVRMADPTALVTELSSSQRGQFLRLDLIFEGALPDFDEDGLPDWWEEKYGTESAVNDAASDLDGDGVSNRDEYLRGTAPTGSDQLPQLLPDYLVNLPLGGQAVPVIFAVDGDSELTDLVYSVTGLSESYRFVRVGAAGEAIESFSQEELSRGRILLESVGAVLGEETFTLRVRDETAGHAAAETTVRVVASEWSELWDAWELPSDGISAELSALAIQDASRLSGPRTLAAPSSLVDERGAAVADATESDVGRLFLGSGGADHLLGSSEGDAFVLGSGDVLRLGGGADRVFVTQAVTGASVLDFSIADGDVLDLRSFLQPSAQRRLHHYLRLSNGRLEIDANGDGSGFTDAAISLAGPELPLDLADLWDGGHLETGEIMPVTTLYLASEGGVLAEEGLQAVTLNFRRRGDARAGLTVPLSFSGTMTLGLDVAMLPSTITFAPGVKTTSLVVQPYADNERETTETLQVQVGVSESWEVAAGYQTLTLELLDLPSRVWLEVGDRVAIKDLDFPGQLILHRSGPLGAELTVRLATTGTATPFVDFRRLPSSITFAPAQSVIYLDVEPLASANISQGAESIVVKILANNSYLMGGQSEATILLVEKPWTLDAWMAEKGIAMTRAEFLSSDSDGDGASGLAEFAFGGNPALVDDGGRILEVLVEPDGRKCLRYRRRIFAPELSYQVKSSATLETWSLLPEGGAGERTQLLGGGFEEVRLDLPEAEMSGFYQVVPLMP